MTTKKDEAINSILHDFEEFANLVLSQLDSLEKMVSSGEVNFPEKEAEEMLVIERKLDKMEVKISDKIVNTIVLYQPVASDIRKVMACYRIIINLERVGDMVINILNFIRNIKTPEVYTELSDTISNMLINSANMVNKALLAFTNDDKEYAIWTIKNDSVFNETNKKMLKKSIKKSSSSNENKQILMISNAYLLSAIVLINNVVPDIICKPHNDRTLDT